MVERRYRKEDYRGPEYSLPVAPRMKFPVPFLRRPEAQGWAELKEAFDHFYFLSLARHFGIFLAAAAQHAGLSVPDFEKKAYVEREPALRMFFPSEFLGYGYKAALAMLQTRYQAERVTVRRRK